MAVQVSAAASVDLVEGVGGGAEPHGNGAGDGADHAEEFGVAPFGGFFPVAPLGDVAVDVAEELACVAFVDPVECTHVLRVAAADVSAMICDVWSGLPARDREVWPAVIVGGCLFFMILGAVLR